MANPRRASAYQLAISPIAGTQSNASTAMPLSSITALIPDTAKNFFNWQQTYEEVLDCSTEEIYTKILTGEIGSLTVSFSLITWLFAVFLAYAFGVAATPTGGGAVKTHALTELPVGSYQPPFFSLVAGFKGQTTPLLLKGCVVKSIKPKIDPRKVIAVEVQIRFIDAVPATGYTFGACVNALPLRSADAALTVGATNFQTAKRQRAVDLNYDNNILDNEFAFTDDTTKATRLERADRRTRLVNYAILGDNQDQEFTDARTGAELPLGIKFTKSATDSIELNSAQAFLELSGGGLKKEGQVGETNIAIIATPEGRMTATVINAQTTAYLTVAT